MTLKRHRIPDMPREYIARHPKVIGMGNGAYGALTRLLDHFWLTDCAPLPTTERQLFMLARAHQATWKDNYADIVEVLRDVIPQLAHHREIQRKRRSVLQDLTDRAVARTRSKALEKSMRLHTSSVEVARPVIAERNRAPTPAAPAAPSIRSGFVEKVR